MRFTSLQITQLLFVGILFLFNIIQSVTLPLIDDEAYYWVWSNHLDFGYYDHPPMVALFIKAGYLLIPNELGVRLISSISNISLYLIWIQILKPKTRKENYLFFGLFGSVGIFQCLGFISTPDTPLLVFGSLFLWRWKVFLSKHSLKNSLLLGLSMALTMYSKYHGALLILLTFLPFISILIKNKWFYLSLLFSLLLYSPHLYWQYNHEWASIQYHFFGRNKKEITGFPFGEWIAGLLLIANPLLLYFYGRSLFFCIQEKNSWIKSLQWICFGGILFFGVFALTRNIQPQWNLIIYMALIPLTYLAYKDKNTAWINRLSYSYLGILLLSRIALLVPFVIYLTPMYRLKQFVFNAYQVSDGIAVFERYQKAALYNFYTGQHSSCLQVYTHRTSQYDLWNSEQKIQGKTITFFGLEGVSSNFIINENGKNEFYKIIDDFHSYPQISCKVSPTSFSTDEDFFQTMDIQWNNPYNIDITLKKDSEQEVGLLLVNSKTLEPMNFIPFSDTINLSKKGSFENTISINISQILPGEYKSYIVLKPYGISGKIISNEMKSTIH